MLYYFAPLTNVSSILERGILSRREVARLAIPHEDFSLPSAQIRRSNMKVAGRSLHDFVPLFMNPCSPMFEERLRELKDRLACCIVSLRVCETEGLYFTDGNLAYAEFGTHVFSSLEEAKQLPWDFIMSSTGNNRVRGAEILVPDRVPPEHILYVLVTNPRDPRVAALLPQPPPATTTYHSFDSAPVFQQRLSLVDLSRQIEEM